LIIFLFIFILNLLHFIFQLLLLIKQALDILLVLPRKIFLFKQFFVQFFHFPLQCFCILNALLHILFQLVRFFLVFLRKLFQSWCFIQFLFAAGGFTSIHSIIIPHLKIIFNIITW